MLRTPWHYLTWRAPVNLSAEVEMAIAQMARRRGLAWCVLIFWGVTAGESITLGSLRLFVGFNYPGLLAALGAWPAIAYAPSYLWASVAASVGLGWMVTVVLGTARHLGWLVSLQQKWPPLGKA